ncbi:MAG TPA: DsrE/DsrF/DrsH-like family protein [Nitrososphaerales archaeon]
MSKRNKDDQKRKSLVIIISKGTLDMAYPPLILAATAASMDMDVDLYFTFWGLSLLNKKKVGADKISPVGNPVLGMPNIIGMLPGMTDLATIMMKGKVKKYWPTVHELMKNAKEAGVRIHACSPTMGLMSVKKEDLIPEVNDIIGASAYLDMAIDADVNLFI